MFMRVIEMCRQIDEALLVIEKDKNLVVSLVEQLQFENKKVRGRWQRVFLEHHIHTLGEFARFYRKVGLVGIFSIRAIGEKSVQRLINVLQNLILSQSAVLKPVGSKVESNVSAGER